MKLKLFDKTQVVDLLKILLSTAVSILPVWVAFEYLKSYADERLLVLGCAVIAIPVYLLLGVLFDIQILRWVYSYAPSRLKIIKKWNSSPATN